MFFAPRNLKTLATSRKLQARGSRRVGMTPPTVDAYDNAQLNEIVFPAGILQPPFYDPSATTPTTTAASAPSSGTK